MLIREVVKELRFLSSASSDNVHWTLSQAEVEFLEFRNAVNWARTAPETPLSTVIVEFDVFYSRHLDAGQRLALFVAARGSGL